MAKIVCLVSKERLKQALDALYYLQKKYKKLYKDDDYFFITINSNIASIQFGMGNTKIPRKCLSELLNNSKRVINHIGIEGLFYCSVIESMIAIDEEDFVYAEFRIKSIERKFKEFLQQEHNKRNRAFLKILKFIVFNNAVWKNEKFREEAWQFILMKPIYEHGSEFISFNAWLYSKLENEPYSEGGYNIRIEKKTKAS